MIPAIDPQRRRLLLAAPALWLATATPLARAAGNGWQPWPRPLAVPGGVARIALGAEITAPQAFNAAGHPLLVVGSADNWTALVGLPLSAEPGEQHIDVRGDSPRRIPFTVVDKRYREQQLKVEPRVVDLAPKDLARHERERARQDKVRALYTAPPEGELRMRLPTQGRRSSEFGYRRVFNGKPRNPHSGIDIAAPTGTRVVAPLAGRVADVGDYFFNGKTVWLDHGGGLLSMMCHMSRITVQEGDVLAVGDKLGEVGSTGRSTGPHLHWTVSLNQASVDPTLFVEG